MFVDAAVTSKLVEQALPFMPFLDVGDEFLTYDGGVAWRERHKKTGKGSEPPSLEEWRVPISAPLLAHIAEISHAQVFAALSTVAIHDRDTSPWGRATQDVQEWVFAPDSVEGLEHPPSNLAAAAVLLAALYGDKGHLFLGEAQRYLERTDGPE
ncbi:hypothetical protein [Streptomyces sp. NPDC006879]|uniref:hypothetical protein n=1 Tax=Streptomyces sp. NPDC006879 TaxID=3364767 RepID=UPI0036A080E5